jgi:hypothetical protein
MNDDFEDLARLKRTELDRLFCTGTPPTLDELVGWEFSGWNCSLLPKLGGFQKFVKGFYRPPDAPLDQGDGFNIVVIQNGIDADWLGLPADDEPRRYGFYRVRPVVPGELNDVPPGTPLLDYGAHPKNPRFDVSRLLRDLLVKIEGSSDLLLGKAHLALGRWPFAGYFLLRRRRRHTYAGTP